jgi:ABC-type uncharacterized transport system permease subunit
MAPMVRFAAMTLTFALFAALLYSASAACTWRRPGPAEVWLALGALLLHSAALGGQIFQLGGLSIGLNEALSLFAWQSALLLWAFSFRLALRPLGLAVYPLAGLFALIAALVPTPLREATGDWKVHSHILLSLLSAGLLTLAAAQALLLAAQERWLHQHESPRLMRALPPLQTMEQLLFQLVAVGFFLLSAALLSGLWFVQDWLAQHLVHKTVLSVTAWLMFGVLLWGRWRHGWRGRQALRWALTSYAMLLLAYFGSKLVLEIILHKHWAT